MVSARAVVENILALILVIACTIVWVAHSQYFYMKFANKKTSVTESNDPATSLAMPNIILCSRSPVKNYPAYTTNSYFVQYLEEALDPSIVNVPGRIELLNNNTLSQAEPSFTNLYLNNIANGKAQVQNMLYACRDVILDCTWQGVTQSGDQCCNMVNAVIPTMDGICWSITGNTQMTQNATGTKNGLLVRLYIDPGKYQRTGQNSHPGFDLFLSDSKDMWRLINELTDSVYVGNSEGIRIGIQKTVTTKLENLECGMSPERAATVDTNAMMDMTKTPLGACVLDYAIWKCQCHPLFSEYLNIEQGRNSALDRLASRITSSQPCKLSVMSTCVQSYMNYLIPANYQQTPMGNTDVIMDVKDCMKNWHVPCQTVNYATTPEYYTLTPNPAFQAEFTVSYSSLQAKQMVESYDMNIIDLASFIGFAGAMWFTVGHIIWSIARVFKSMCCKREVGDVEPKKERAPLTPYVTTPHNPEVYQNPPTTDD